MMYSETQDIFVSFPLRLNKQLGIKPVALRHFSLYMQDQAQNEQRKFRFMLTLLEQSH